MARVLPVQGLKKKRGQRRERRELLSGTKSRQRNCSKMNLLEEEERLEMLTASIRDLKYKASQLEEENSRLLECLLLIQRGMDLRAERDGEIEKAGFPESSLDNASNLSKCELASSISSLSVENVSSSVDCQAPV
ncbi:hypothetical protein NDN08_007595 [Rhodosorus marinus]|uniref:BZIP domain-containing protein n=1 Tax=Rhodosorus marinus TaxID=101924 RepID=A0AAV8UYA7_9RHOD|nr:hypothetical protein NDN08_007595 [Rhodosorus marinus]